jgi:hypothetical protein
MKCKSKRCALESRHGGKCSPVGPYAINKEPDAINEREVAINTPSITSHEKKVLKELREMVARVEKSDTKIRVALGMTPNRRKREDYNAYMKRKMKERREEEARLKRAGFIGIAYG